MSRYQFELSCPKDDQDLRVLFAATPMDGNVRVRLEHDPAVHRQHASDDHLHQTIVCRDTLSGRVIGAGSRQINLRYVNGQLRPVGYLGGLRCLPEHRSRGLVARGYAFLKELHQDQRADFYLTTIAADNASAERVLTSGRAGLPVYRPIGRFHTLLCCSHNRRRHPSNDSVEIRTAESNDLPAIARLVQHSGPDRQFFPAYGADDFQDSNGTFHGLSLESILVARRGGQLVGLLAGWNQSSFRRAVIAGYNSLWKWLRPAWNAWASIRQRPRLPGIDEALVYLTAACPLVINSDPAIFVGLLDAAIDQQLPDQRTSLTLGLADNDPLLGVARSRRWREYVTNIFLVSWPDTQPDLPTLDHRPIYLELGCL
ncbi:MAG TPA: hypothetical protein DCE39_12100 [Planctomycetaceae bacterium]|nr:hypothetical protein [Planctomycetaceae bacterium]|tara:strand:+ start:861 stop:1973 length:1113 start_codon:yes stop_codon:yes gene_type:complete